MGAKHRAVCGVLDGCETPATADDDAVEEVLHFS